MKVLVTGYTGQLGYDIVKTLQTIPSLEVRGVGSKDLDITDELEVTTFFNDYKPEVVIHCAAYTAVDNAETQPEVCYKINVWGTQNIADNCLKHNCKLFYISTDYVFDGTEDFYDVYSIKKPLNVYGMTKAEAETYVITHLNKYFILRVSWLFGKNGNNFVKTMVKLSNRDVVNVVSDQIGSPTYTKDVAELISQMLFTEKYGTYHVTNEGFTTWAEFAEEIFKQINSKTKVNKLTTAEYNSLNNIRTKRPLNSKLSKELLIKNGFNKLEDWRAALKKYLREI